MIDFATIRTSQLDCRHIARIASRAEHMGLNTRDRIDIIMDLEAAHHVCPLNLDALHNASPTDFAHDVRGIINHLNRDTGTIANSFRPRYAR